MQTQSGSSQAPSPVVQTPIRSSISGQPPMGSMLPPPLPSSVTATGAASSSASQLLQQQRLQGGLGATTSSSSQTTDAATQLLQLRAGSLISARAADDDAEGDDDLLPDMEDDGYSAQLSWQSQSKDNLKCVSTSTSPPLFWRRIGNDGLRYNAFFFRFLMDNFSPEQYDRYEAYRRNALPKQAVRRVCCSSY